MKYSFLLFIERLVNTVSRIFHVRVILLPGWYLHDKDISWRGDGLVTSHSVNFLEDAKFKDTIAEVRKGVDHSVYHEYRVYIGIKIAEAAARVEGSCFVECGVGEGILSSCILRYVNPIQDMYLIDTYSGIDPTLVNASVTSRMGGDGEKLRQHALRSYKRSSLEDNIARFAAYPNVKLIEGSIPSVLAGRDFQRVSYLHIDMNNPTPEVAALEFFWPRLSIPGYVLLDDYGSKGMVDQKRAIDACCQRLGIPQAISLPTGQGLLLKSH
jgi:hypothetical protein